MKTALHPEWVATLNFKQHTEQTNYIFKYYIYIQYTQ